MRILCLDGGGSKGIYTLGVLGELEKSYGPLHEAFDAVYGTSTGSIIAAGIAIGLSTDELTNFYLNRVGRIMKVWSPKGRSAELRNALNEVFAEKTFTDVALRLGIVATDLDNKRLLVFKSDPAAAYSLKNSFVPGFGCKLADAVRGSCSAFPFFPPVKIATANQGTVHLVDGGYIANNPALIAYADATKGLELAAAEIQVVSVGTGIFPSRYPKESLFQLVRLAINKQMLEVQFDGSANAIAKMFEIYSRGSRFVRINEAYAEPSLACSLFEYDRERLDRLKSKGRESYSKHEHKIDSLMKSE